MDDSGRLFSDKLHAWLLTYLRSISLLPFLTARCRLVLGLNDGCLLNLFQMVNLPINVCGRAYRATVCNFLVFWLQVAIEPFAFFHCLYVLYVFLCDASKLKKRTPMQTEHIFVIWRANQN